ncbi:hypothetical protein [Limnoglobus roseus]|uniref:hypothetical protein n=1 Tax=Limnoglobus roseus TaxID=2598579 RepID=UPI0011EAEBAF|nr:hypothetical protein [Limnoglobus roseus]
MKSKIPLYVVVALVLGAAVVHGAITQRWSVFTPDAARTDRMHALRISVPDCDVSDIESDVPLKERSVATSRRYQPQDQEYVALVSIISGVPGAVSTHTPDVCYQASGYRMMRGIKRETVKLTNGETATFFVTDFEKKKETTVERLRIRWSWTTNGTWEAPDYARFHYMKAAELYKLYVATPLPEADGKAAEDPAAVQQFVRAAFEQYAAAFR